MNRIHSFTSNAILLLAVSLYSVLFFSSCGESVNTNYRELCRNNDFDGAHKVLDKLYDDYSEEGEKYGREELKKYHTALDYIFNSEALYLFSLNDEQANQRIIFLLKEIPVEGRKPSNNTVCGYYDYDPFFSDEGYQYYLYKSYATSYNEKCSQLLDLAITNKKQDLAEMLLTMYIDDIEVVDRPKSEQSGDDEKEKIYIITDTSKKEGEAKFAKAFSN